MGLRGWKVHFKNIFIQGDEEYTNIKIILVWLQLSEAPGS